MPAPTKQPEGHASYELKACSSFDLHSALRGLTTFLRLVSQSTFVDAKNSKRYITIGKLSASGEPRRDT